MILIYIHTDMAMKNTLLATLLLLSYIAAIADETTIAPYPPRNPNTKVTVLGSDIVAPDSVKLAFEENAPSVRDIEGIPRFAIVGKEGKFYMGIGANLRLLGIFDWRDDIGSDLFFTPANFTPATPGNRSRLSGTAQSSNIYMNIVALPGQRDRFSLFILTSFDNPNYGMRLRYLYGKYRGLTLGYTDTPFTDGDAVPATIDSEGACGTVFYKTVTASWDQDFGHGFSGSIGIDVPKASLTYDANVGKVNQRIPAVPFYLQYRWGDGSHVRASALLRPMQYRDLLSERNRAIFGWGVQLSGLWDFLPGFCFHYDAVYGRGITDYLCDGAGIAADGTPSISSPGRMDTSESLGLSVGLSYNILRNLKANALYSQMRVYPLGSSLHPESDYRYSQYLALNLMYYLNRYIMVGMEYDWGKKDTYGGDKLCANRLQALFSLSF